jgi:hypothetical protein
MLVESVVVLVLKVVAVLVLVIVLVIVLVSVEVVENDVVLVVAGLTVTLAGEDARTKGVVWLSVT